MEQFIRLLIDCGMDPKDVDFVSDVVVWLTGCEYDRPTVTKVSNNCIRF